MRKRDYEKIKIARDYEKIKIPPIRKADLGMGRERVNNGRWYNGLCRALEECITKCVQGKAELNGIISFSDE